MEETLDIAQVWKDIEDRLGPLLHFLPRERGLYYYLLRHSRLEGHRETRITLSEIGLQLNFSYSTVRDALRNLVRKGCIRVISRTSSGQFVEVFLPAEILANWNAPKPEPPVLPGRSAELTVRHSIWRRDGGRCFYCLRKLYPAIAVLDHIVPQSEGGDDSSNNLASCCRDCNAEKGAEPAADFLRELFRNRRLTPGELDERLAALQALKEPPPVTLPRSPDPLP